MYRKLPDYVLQDYPNTKAHLRNLRLLISAGVVYILACPIWAESIWSGKCLCGRGKRDGTSTERYGDKSRHQHIPTANVVILPQLAVHGKIFCIPWWIQAIGS